MYAYKTNYSKLFVDIDKPRAFVADIIQKSTNGDRTTHFVDCEQASFDVRDNNELSRSKIVDSGKDGIRYYRYIVDVEQNERSNKRCLYVAIIRPVIRELEDVGAKVVAACYLEDQLRTDEVIREYK